MNPILADIYSTILPSAPYLVAAYALVWAALLVYALIILRGTKRAQAQMTLIEEELAERTPPTQAAEREPQTQAAQYAVQTGAAEHEAEDAIA